jgi:intergrase/recombinase
LLLFCPSSSAWQSEGFVSFLRSQGKTSWTIKQTKNYAIKYGHILDTGDASELMSLRTRHNALSALANLAKYQGRYQVFLEIRQRYALKWTSGNDSLQTLQRFFNPELSLDTMLDWVRKAIAALPADMASIIKFNCMTGLRPAEAVESVRLLNSGNLGCQYYNEERQALEHFRFPEIFLRRTKKAYLSFITCEQLSAIGVLDCKNPIPTIPTPTHNAIRLACRKRWLKMDMRYCRKIFGSWLHSQSGIATEEIDFLQGRVNPSVFSRHYLTPSQDLKSKVIEALEQLQRQL